MFRGLLSGGVLGVAVSGLALATASLVTEPPAGARPPLAPVVEPPGLALGSGDIVRTSPDAVPGGTVDAGGAPAPSETPQVAVPGVEAALPDADTALPVAPLAGQAGGGLTAPETPGAAPQVAASEPPVVTAVPVRPSEPAAAEAEPTLPVEPLAPAAVPPSVAPEAPVVPAQGGDVVPPAPAQGTVGAEATPPAPVAQVAPEPVEITETDPAARPEAEVESLAGQQLAELSDAAPVLPEAAEAAPAPPAPDLGAPSIDELLPVTGDVAAPLPEVVEILPDAAAPETALPEPDLTEPPEQEETEEADQSAPGGAETAPPQAPRIALSGGAASLPGSTSAVRVTRPGEAAEPPAEPVEAAPVETILDGAPAVVRYAAAFDNLDGKPLMSIVLIDDGQLGAGAVAALQAVPFAVTVAIDATVSGAPDTMAAYRAAGFEVMALASLPEGALPSDADVTLEATFAALPETIGLLDAGTGGLQSDRAVTEQAMARLALDGRAFVTLSQGLNPALRSAEGAGVRAAAIYRDLDSEGQDARVIRRFLDQAAFRARQQTGVVLLGRVRGDTISALTLWGTANRAGQVTLAPVSAMLVP